MGWFLGCFKNTGRAQQAKPKKLSSSAANLVFGRTSSAVVAHATSPEDLHRVRKSPAKLAVANRNRGNENESLDSSSSSLTFFLSRTKKNEGTNICSKSNDANKCKRERPYNCKLDDELERVRERLIPEVDAEKQLSDEVKDVRTCHSVQESPNAFKVMFDKSEKDTSRQADFAQQSWLVSSLVTNSGVLFEACSTPSSPFLGLHEHGSFQRRGLQASQSIDFYDNLGSSNALKCAELKLFNVESGVSDECVSCICDSLQPIYCKVEMKTEAAPLRHEIQSPPWIFSEAKLDNANHNSSYIFGSSDDLLCEHLDVSSLIEDSVLIANWERSYGQLQLEKRGLHDQLHVLSQGGGGKLLGKKKQKLLENGPDGDSLDFNSGCSMVTFEVPSNDETGLFAQPSVDEGYCSTNGGEEFIYVGSNLTSDTKAQLLQEECCTGIKESDNESSSQSCLSSQFRLSKHLWSRMRKNPFERDSNMAGYLHDNESDADEMLLPHTEQEIQPLWESKNSEDEYHSLLNALTESSETCIGMMGNHNQCSGVKVDNHIQSSTASFLEALARQDFAEVFAFEDEMVAMMEGDSNMGSFPTEDENTEQRKKLRLEHSNSFERVQESKLVVKDEQMQLLNTAAFGDHHESGLEARDDFFNDLESSALEQTEDKCSFQQTADTACASPSSLHAQTSMTSYRLSADDRPILGTVAAYWSPIITKKWWDGKGIPNSTNKYKEDQKVKWHGIPFEVRLEQALSKQDKVVSK